MIIFQTVGLLSAIVVIIGAPIVGGWFIVKQRQRQLLSFDKADTTSFWGDTVEDVVTRRLTPPVRQRRTLPRGDAEPTDTLAIDQYAEVERGYELSRADTAVIPKVGGPNDDTALIPHVGRVTALEPNPTAEADWFFQQDPLGAASLPEQLEPNLIGVQVFIDLAEQKVLSGGTLDLQVTASWVPWGYEVTKG